jgi:transposase
MQFFVGIDVSLDSSSICVIDERGVIIKEGKTASEPAAIARFIRHKGRKIEHVGLETGSLSQWRSSGSRSWKHVTCVRLLQRCG